MVVDPAVPAALASSADNGVERVEEVRLGVEVVSPSGQRLLCVTEIVCVIAAVVGNNVVHVARLAMDREVAWNLPSVNTGDQATRNLVGAVTVTGPEVGILRIDAIVKEGVLTPRTVDRPEVTTMLNAVSETVSSEHTLIAGTVPDQAVERVP